MYCLEKDKGEKIKENKMTNFFMKNPFNAGNVKGKRMV
jgi:hypothetical protein